MDFQTIINIGAGTALTATGWLARELWGAVKDLRQDIAKLREELPKIYITKDDFKVIKDDFRGEWHEIKEMLRDIGAKLDTKADK